MEAIADHIKKPRRWVDDYIETLDPDKDYAKILGLMAEYQQDELSLHMMITSTNCHVVMPPHGAEAQVFSGKFIRRPSARTQDSLDFFWTWFSKGPDHPDTIESVNRLNDIHLNVGKHLPGHFGKSSDFVYTFCMLAIGQDRVLRKVGLPGFTDIQKRAAYNFMKRLASHFRREGYLPLENFPDSFEGMEAYADAWEHWDHEYSPVQTELISALIDQFATLNFPPPLRPLARWIVMYTVPDHILKHYRIEPLTGIRRRIAHAALKGMFIFKTRYAADAKIPFTERREAKTREELAAKDKVYTKRALRLGFKAAGKEAIGYRDQGGKISMCPVVHIPPDGDLPGHIIEEPKPNSVAAE